MRLGLLVLAVVRLSGATHVVVSDLDASRRELATRLGATRTVDPAAEDLLGVVREMTEGRGVDCAFEAVGAQATIEQAFELPRPGGTLVQVSVPPTTARPALPAYELFSRELTIRGSYVRTTEFRRAVELLGYARPRPADHRSASRCARSTRPFRLPAAARASASWSAPPDQAQAVSVPVQRRGFWALGLAAT